MSKPAVPAKQKTLFSFFTSAPKPASAVEAENACVASAPTVKAPTPLSSATPSASTRKSSISTGRTTNDSFLGSKVGEPAESVVVHKKRRLVDDEDSPPPLPMKQLPKTKADPAMSEDEQWSDEPLEDSASDVSEAVPVKRSKPPKAAPVSRPAPKKAAPVCAARESEEPVEATDEAGAGGVFSVGQHEHHQWHFLQPKHRRDKAGRVDTDPMYNPRTLQVPRDEMDKLTPAMRQWMEFKADNMDAVLFFKVGKFYELYHMDADVGVRELDLVYMKGSKAHSGFPEISYGKYASILVNLGLKVARVEQTETPDMLKERNDAMPRGGGKKDKVVRREMCSILTRGTRTHCHMDEAAGSEAWARGLSASVLLCVVEQATEDGRAVEYGVCAVDTVLGLVTVAQFQDDAQLSRLRTMVARFSPSEVLLERCCSTATSSTVAMLVPAASIELLHPSETLSAQQTLDLIDKEKYYADAEGAPEVMRAVGLGLQDGSTELLLRAVGGALYRMRRCCIDFEIMSARKFFAYVPPDMDLAPLPVPTEASERPFAQKHMVLDAIALANLEILVNNFDRTEKGSLWSFVNRCKTAFGRRLLREWLCKPLLSLQDIKLRRDAVEELMGIDAEAEAARNLLKKLPDVERLLSRVHCNGLVQRSTSHPDSRAVMFEPAVYSARKIRDFAEVLTSFEEMVQVIRIFEGVEGSSSLLVACVKATPMGKYPLTEMQKQLSYFRSVFDEKAAKKDGTITPKFGVNEQYDQAQSDLKDAHERLQNYLKELKKSTGISSLAYFGSNKDRFQIEVPMELVSRVPRDWVSKSQKKSHRRYYTTTVEGLFNEVQDAEGRMAVAQKDTLRSIFQRFDSKAALWTQAIECVSTLDALLSLAKVSAAPGYCWPDFLPSHKPVLDIAEGRHPMLDQTLAERGDVAYIPNSVALGNPARLMLVSGPNMGGKSTLLRQTCLIAVLAQIGCRVPAQRCRMTLVDRIFTRVGASDRILSGQSTFFVELAETASILLNATTHSLCILDELGRGTATFDGTAIAHAVTDHLVTKVCCRAMFATHYHSLVEDWEMDPRVSLGHMDCIVQGSDEATKDSENVTFLYKLCGGASPKSYGINVAKLAKLPEIVIQLARQHSQAFELRCAAETGADLVARDLYVKYFDRLVSLARSIDSPLSDGELVFCVQELWKRFVHAVR